MQSYIVNVPARKYEVPTGLRVYSVNTSRRNFTVSTSRRDFGIAIQGWRLWGQTDIHPFQVGGEDSTKTFGELP
jgi:hypothetical protein